MTHRAGKGRTVLWTIIDGAIAAMAERRRAHRHHAIAPFPNCIRLVPVLAITLRRGRIGAIALTFLAAAAVSQPSLASFATDPRPASSCGDTETTSRCLPEGSAPTGTAEEQLAATYAPVASLKRQRGACDMRGEPFFPAPVDLIFHDPSVLLRQATTNNVRTDPVIVTAPTAQDLAGKDGSYYLDLPGDPRAPDCTYERSFKARAADVAPVTYAHVIIDAKQGKLTLQYWFWYYFNDFTDTHESDWEMIQIVFAAKTIEDALRKAPLWIAVAQHGGGETADWKDARVRKEGTHPVIYPAAGSHATYFGSHVYLGWGENGTGFGCDDTTGPSDRVALHAVLLPDTPDPTGPFAWLLFRGRWGERGPAPFEGPHGPQLSTQWRQPIVWMAVQRGTSLTAPDVGALGPSPSRLFCGLVGGASRLFLVARQFPPLVIGGLLVTLAAVIWLAVWEAPLLRAAWSLYRRHWTTFAGLGLPLGALIVAAHGIRYLALRFDLRWVEQIIAQPSAAAAGSFLEQDILFLLIGPAVVQTVAAIRRGHPHRLGQVYAAVWSHMALLARTLALFLIAIGLLARISFGALIAIAVFARWFFVIPAIVLEGVEAPRHAIHLSAIVVHRQRLRVFLAALVLVTAVNLPAALAGMALMIGTQLPLVLVGLLSGLLYACVVPVGFIGYALLYQMMQTQRGGRIRLRTLLAAPVRPAPRWARRGTRRQRA